MGVLFEDREIDNLNLSNLTDTCKAVSLLCSQEIPEGKDEVKELAKSQRMAESRDEVKLLARTVQRISSEQLSHAQFNELLLLLNQLRIGKGFFSFFFQPDAGKITTEKFKDGITRFCGYAMLCYGNFRFSYKKWSDMSESEIEKDIREHCCLVSDPIDALDGRPDRILHIEVIPREHLHYLGYLSGAKLAKDLLTASALLYKASQQVSGEKTLAPDDMARVQEAAASIKKSELSKWSGKILQITEDLNRAQHEVEKCQKIGENNTKTYLSWEYMDIYVATSMREQWEFQDTYDFVRRVFEQSAIAALNLRYFDPTQSWVKDRIEKGLVEALMLKRARATLYLAQETDTLGKDSELAITLAQGKPVVAYIPEIEIEAHSQKISAYPLEFFRRRLALLEAEDMIPECADEVFSRLGRGVYQIIDEFKDKLNRFFTQRTFRCNVEEENEFKNRDLPLFQQICQVTSIMERRYFDVRSELLKSRHPLGLQVNLRTGVANGVLVVRSVESCVELLRRIFRGDMKFVISRAEDGVSLTEEISASCFRIVTRNPMLSNSFWNFYLNEA